MAQSASSSAQPLIGHIAELRRRLLHVLVCMAAGMGVSYLFVDEIYEFLVRPLAGAMQAGDNRRLIYTGLTEAFFTSLKVAFFAGMFLTFPVLLLQIWRFVAPGLYANEKKVLWPFLLATPLLFFLGGACVYYLVLPMAWPFFLGFQTTGAQTGLPIQLEARISEYLDLVMSLIFAFGLCFQLPVLLSLLAMAGFLTDAHLVKARKYAIVVIFIVAAVMTPPDVLSQFLLAVPLLILYEVSIWLIRYLQHQKTNKSDISA